MRFCPVENRGGPAVRNSEEVEELITKKQVGPLQGFRSKLGLPFAAIIKMNARVQAGIRFRQRPERGRRGRRAGGFHRQGTAGQMSRSAARRFLTPGMNYICEKATGAGQDLHFRTGKIILQQEIEPEQVKKLLADRQNRFAQGIYFQENQPQVRGVSGVEGRQDGV